MTTAETLPHLFVTFLVDHQLYALSLSQVSRAVRMAAITPVPEAVPWIAGFVNIAGCIVPVVGLRRRIGGGNKELNLNDRLLILNVQRQQLALIVDQVCEVLERTSSQLEPPPDTLFETHSQLISGVFQHRDDLILVLDPDRLLTI
jgi:purine-binding chemotaxis protein CheW